MGEFVISCTLNRISPRWSHPISNPINASVRSVTGRQTNSKLGILLMIGGMFLFSAIDTQAKFLTSTFHPTQVIWFRQLGLLIGVLILLYMKGPTVLRACS